MRGTILLLAAACAGSGDTDTDTDTDVTTVDACDATETFPDVVAWRVVPVPDDCQGVAPDAFADPPTVLTTAADFEAAARCPAGTPTGVDFAAERVVVAIFLENPDAVALGAHADGGRVRVQLAAPRYCGGAPPPDTALLVAVPASDAAVYVDACLYGACDGPPRP